MQKIVNGLLLFAYIILSLFVFAGWVDGYHNLLTIGAWLFLTYHLGSKLTKPKGRSW